MKLNMAVQSDPGAQEKVAAFPGLRKRPRDRPNPDSAGTAVVLLAIAHPDDESMFFVPTLLHLKESGATVHVLCLSTGNADKLGPRRCVELVQACGRLGVPPERVEVLDRPDMQDGMSTVWPAEAVTSVLAEAVRKTGATHVVTFDAGGVSGHGNHVAVYRGAVGLVVKQAAAPPVWVLETTGLLRKYLGAWDAAWSLLWAKPGTVVLVQLRPLLAYWVMSTHASQFVWYRRLFVLLSRYSYVNTLTPLSPAAATSKQE